jgi:hypothetical protein
VQLKAASKQAAAYKYPVVVTKLDRLSRAVAFISNLMAKSVPLIVTEIPNADPFMLHNYAAVAGQERLKISEAPGKHWPPLKRAVSGSAIRASPASKGAYAVHRQDEASVRRSRAPAG